MNYQTLFKDTDLDYSIVLDKEAGEYLIVINAEAFPIFRRAYRLTPDEVRKVTQEDIRLLALAKELIAESTKEKYADRLVPMG